VPLSSVQKLQKFNNEVGDLFLQHAQMFLEKWDEVLVDAQRTILEQNSQSPMCLKVECNLNRHHHF
jgi:hypothetical protein